MTIDEWVAKHCPLRLGGVEGHTADDVLRDLLEFSQDARFQSLQEIRARHRRMAAKLREVRRELDAARSAFDALRLEIETISRINRSHVHDEAQPKVPSLDDDDDDADPI